MDISKNIEKIPMKDPCLECETLEKRNLFFEQIYPQSTDSKEPSAPSLFRQTLEQYQQSHLKYKHLIETAPDAIFVADTETGMILEANTKAAELLGIPADQIVGMHQSQLHPPEEAEQYAEIFREHVQKESAHILEDVYLCNEAGEKIPIQISASVAQFGDKKVIYGIFRDMSEQKLLQQQLTATEQKYKELYRNARAALFRTRISDGTLLDCSRAAARLFGYVNEDEYKQNFSVTNTYVDPQQRQSLIEALMKNKRVHNFQLQLKRKDGSPLWVAISAEIFPERDFIEGAMQDITVTKVLSKTENDILEHLMEGTSNKEIAFKTRRSVRTIEDHRSHIMHKLGVDNIVDLTQKALKLTNHYSKE
jgi:PAS domain S-box-containing protein